MIYTGVIAIIMMCPIIPLHFPPDEGTPEELRSPLNVFQRRVVGRYR